METNILPDTEQQVAPQRDKLRESIFLGAVISLGDDVETINVRVRNISSGGMMIDLPGPQAKGLVVVAQMKGIGKISGQIAWSTENRTGVAFDHIIDPKLARHQPANSGATYAPLYNKIVTDKLRRPGLAIR